MKKIKIVTRSNDVFAAIALLVDNTIFLDWVETVRKRVKNLNTSTGKLSQYKPISYQSYEQSIKDRIDVAMTKEEELEYQGLLEDLEKSHGDSLVDKQIELEKRNRIKKWQDPYTSLERTVNRYLDSNQIPRYYFPTAAKSIMCNEVHEDDYQGNVRKLGKRVTDIELSRDWFWMNRRNSSHWGYSAIARKTEIPQTTVQSAIDSYDKLIRDFSPYRITR